MKQSLSPHFFGLIVVDESHRSIYNTLEAIAKECRWHVKRSALDDDIKVAMDFLKMNNLM